MRKTAAVAILVALAASPNTANAGVSNGALVAACQAEAKLGYVRAWQLEPSLRAVIEDQRARMSAACARVAAEKDAALNDCLVEAARGPRHIQRGRNMDREHIGRQKALCRRLAASN